MILGICLLVGRIGAYAVSLRGSCYGITAHVCGWTVGIRICAGRAFGNKFIMEMGRDDNLRLK
jgi:hypothetical protein